jgi:hypothetical protein
LTYLPKINKFLKNNSKKTVKEVFGLKNMTSYQPRSFWFKKYDFLPTKKFLEETFKNE